MMPANETVIVQALEAAGIEFMPEDANGGEGVRLRKARKPGRKEKGRSK
jgi:hypothetical protein